ncbi:MAG: hypothetical protein R6X08_01575 [Desulfosalsimonadaceae bacterium]
MMKQIAELKQDKDLIHSIDWSMTPEEAVILYLEWGNNWAHGRVVRSKTDVSNYFVVYAWDERPVIYLIRRNSEGAEELAQIGMPPDLEAWFMASTGRNKGVYAVDGKVREWLESELYSQ